jgi:hypothetical protein
MIGVSVPFQLAVELLLELEANWMPDAPVWFRCQRRFGKLSF